MLQLLLTAIIVLNDLKIVALPIRLLEMSANVGGRSQDTEGQGTKYMALRLSQDEKHSLAR